MAGEKIVGVKIETEEIGGYNPSKSVWENVEEDGMQGSPGPSKEYFTRRMLVSDSGRCNEEIDSLPYVRVKITTGIPDENDNMKSNREGNTNLLAEGEKEVFQTGGNRQVLEFDCLADGEKYYMDHATKMGFSVRKDILRKDCRGNCIGRRWVCAKEGYKKEKWLNRTDKVREPRGLTRVGCKASFRVKLVKGTGKWRVMEFNDSHTHKLASVDQVQFLRSNRQVNDENVALGKGLRQVGINTSTAMEYMVGNANGYDKVGFTRKDLQNKMDEERRATDGDGDAKNLINYIEVRKEADPSLYFDYRVDSESRMRYMFWSDSGARADYQVFGDVVGFDATYKTNRYKQPLVLFVGINHHKKTNLFGVGLLAEETVEAYTWLLATFMKSMVNKQPRGVITDGDKAMRKAIQTVMPKATHRLCCWHLDRNATSNVGDVIFTGKLAKLMGANVTIDEFERKWKNLIEKRGLKDNVWTQKLYNDRTLWAQAYLREDFFGGMRSTQRCESINAFINRYVASHLTYLELYRQLARAVEKMRNIEAEDDFHSEYSQPVLQTHLLQYEGQARQEYTKNVFFFVRAEISGEGTVVVNDKMCVVGGRVYKISQFEDRKKTWTVISHQLDSIFECSCKLMETTGFPCRHIFCVMKAEHVEYIPPCMILSRYTKTAKLRGTTFGCSITEAWTDTKRARVGAMMASCKKMCQFAANSDEGYKEAMECIYRMTMRAQEIIRPDKVGDEGKERMKRGRDIVKDPPIVKGNANWKLGKDDKRKRQRKCSNCRKGGHTKTTCKTTPQVAAMGKKEKVKNCEQVDGERAGGNESDGIRVTRPNGLKPCCYGDDNAVQSPDMNNKNNDFSKDIGYRYDEQWPKIGGADESCAKGQSKAVNEEINIWPTAGSKYHDFMGWSTNRNM